VSPLPPTAAGLFQEGDRGEVTVGGLCASTMRMQHHDDGEAEQDLVVGGVVGVLHSHGAGAKGWLGPFELEMRNGQRNKRAKERKKKKGV